MYIAEQVKINNCVMEELLKDADLHSFNNKLNMSLSNKFI